MTIAQQLNIKEFPFQIKDKRGNRIYEERVTKYWVKREFDVNNNQIYYENSHEFWTKKEYDINSNQVYYENSNGVWGKREYDKDGNRIYYENSNGVIRDNRPKPSCEGKEVEIDGKTYVLKEKK